MNEDIDMLDELTDLQMEREWERLCQKYSIEVAAVVLYVCRCNSCGELMNMNHGTRMTECCDEQDNGEIYICTGEELEAFEKFHAERVDRIEKEDLPTQDEMDDLLPLEEDGVFVGGSYFTWDEYRDILR